MPANTKKYMYWRRKFKEKLVENRQWSDFNKLQKQIYKREMDGGCYCHKVASRRAWEEAAESFPVMSKCAFNHEWSTRMRNLRKGKRLKKAIAIQKLLPNNTNWIRRIVRDGLRRIDEVNEKEAARRKEQYHRWREKMDKEELQRKARELDKKEKQIEKELEKERKAKEAAENKHEEFSQKIYDHEKKNKLMPDVVIEDDGPTDQKRDVNWVYDNLSRLIITNDLGLEQLDMDVLETAPSNGAVAMAHYALNNRSNFFEKFVIKSLAKTETVEEVTEEQSQEETIDVDCDPTFEGLEKYIARHVED